MAASLTSKGTETKDCLFIFDFKNVIETLSSAVFSGGAGGARAPPEFGGSQKGLSLISAYQSLAITTNTPGFEKLNTALLFKHKSEYLLANYSKTFNWSNIIAHSDIKL